MKNVLKIFGTFCELKLRKVSDDNFEEMKENLKK